MQARIVNIGNSGDRGQRVCVGMANDLARANIILYVTPRPTAPRPDGEALARRSLGAQMDELRAMLPTGGRRGGAAQGVARRVRRMQRQVDALAGRHALAAHWPDLDLRVNLLYRDLRRLTARK